MGNCLAALFGKPKRSKSYFTGRYKDSAVDVEFDNLIEDDNDECNERDLVNQREKDLLVNRQFSKLVEEQKRVDAEIDAMLHGEEENTRLEEEAYVAAKKEAARIAKHAKILEQKKKKKKPVANGSVKSWVGEDGDWSLANEEEEDFDSFLQTVTARSENVRASVASMNTANKHPPTHPPANDAPPTSPFITSELTQEENPGIKGVVETRPRNIPNHNTTLTDQVPFQNSTSTDLFSSQKTDLEWESDFVSAEMDLHPRVSVNEAGDAPPKPEINRNSTPSKIEQASTNSFSITEEEEDDDDDDEILDINKGSTEQLFSPNSNGTVLDDGSSNSTKIEVNAFDIDIDKFLEELDAEL